MKRAGRQILIAEVKTASPAGWRSEESWQERFAIAEQHGDWIAVHTDERWGGSFKLLEEARRLTDKPILAKGIHETDDLIEQCFLAGANYALAVGRIPQKHANQCLIEPWGLEDLPNYGQHTPVVWNSRDVRQLGTEQFKLDPTTGQPIAFEKVKQLRPQGWICQASGISSMRDVHPETNAMLVGTHLPEFVKSLKV
jgi:indole-3-glycerol phosphate synthase